MDGAGTRESGRSAGALIARALAGSWRPIPPHSDLSPAELDLIAPLLIGWGAGGLVWWKIRQGDAALPAVFHELQPVYRLQAAQDIVREQQIVIAVSLLRSAGIEPLLLKGRAIAAHYAEPGLRPSGDIDLAVRPEQQALAGTILSVPECKDLSVDLAHEELGHLGEHGWDALYDRSQILTLDSGNVRTLGPEDHLSFLCLHFLRHGAWRPLWLCDISAALESRPTDFDWERCLGSDERRAGWIACAIELTHQLLEARVSDTPMAARAGTLPPWLAPAVLEQWERAAAAHLTPSPIRSVLRRPHLLPAALQARWPDPIEATIRMDGSFDHASRFPYQAAGYLTQLGMFISRLRASPEERAST